MKCVAERCETATAGRESHELDQIRPTVPPQVKPVSCKVHPLRTFSWRRYAEIDYQQTGK